MATFSVALSDAAVAELSAQLSVEGFDTGHYDVRDFYIKAHDF